jgi:MFS family permease
MKQQSSDWKKNKDDTRKSLLTACNVVAITVFTAFPVFYPGAINELLQQEFEVQPYVIGFLFSLFWFASILGANFNRRLQGRIMLKYSLFKVLIATAFAVIIMSLGLLVGLGIGVLISGWLYGYSQPLTNQLITDNCDHKIRGLVFGVKQASIPLATLIAGISLSLIILIGWKMFLFVIGIVMLGYSFLFYTSTPNSSKNLSPMSNHTFQVDRELKMMACVGLLGGAIGNSLGAYLISSLVMQNIDLVIAGIIVSIGAILNIVVRIVAGMLVDRSNINAYYLLTSMFVSGVIGALLIITNIDYFVIIGAVLAYGAGWGWPGVLHYTVSKQYIGYEGKVTSITQMGVSTGSALGPLLFGLLFVFVHPYVAWAVFASFGLLASILLMKLGVKQREKVRGNSGECYRKAT